MSTVSVRSVAAGMLAIVALAASAFLALRREETDPVRVKPAEPARGVSCPHIVEAAENFESSDDQAFRTAVEDAAFAAERALETSGELFGPPEFAALNLLSALSEERADTSRIERLLSRATQACSTLKA